jgi:hypothetical protein
MRPILKHGLTRRCTRRAMIGLASLHARVNSNIMRFRSAAIIALAVLVSSPSPAGEPHAYLLALHEKVFVPKDLAVRVTLVPNVLSYLHETKLYKVDEKLKGLYPSGKKEIEGPSDSGFVITVTLGPKNNLPMSRKNGVYSERKIQRPYWKERIYGYETPQGTLAVNVREGIHLKSERTQLIEESIREDSLKWVVKE